MIKKSQHENISVNYGEDVGVNIGLTFGAVAAGLIGFLGVFSGLVIGSAAGSAAGGIAAHYYDIGLPDFLLAEFYDKFSDSRTATAMQIMF